jgi:hypothetical protein
MKVIKEELVSLKENDTWKLVNRPINAKVIQNHWVMCVKNYVTATLALRLD